MKDVKEVAEFVGSFGVFIKDQMIGVTDSFLGMEVFIILQ